METIRGTDTVTRAVRHIPLIAWIRQAPVDRGDQSQLLIDFPQQQNSSFSRQTPAIEQRSDRLSPTREKTTVFELQCVRRLVLGLVA